MPGRGPPRRDRDRQLRLAVAGLARAASRAPTRCSTSSRTSSRAAGADMAPEAVIAALGGSIAAEELKGDYAAAEAAAAAALDAARAGGDPPALADAAIWAGIVAALRSEPRRGGRAARGGAGGRARPPARARAAALRPRRRAAGCRTGTRRPSEAAGLWTEPRTGDPLEPELKALTLLPAYRTTLQLVARHASAGAGDPRRRPADAASRCGTAGRTRTSRPPSSPAAWTRSSLAQQHLDAATAGYAAAGDVAGLAGCDLARGRLGGGVAPAPRSRSGSRSRRTRARAPASGRPPSDRLARAGARRRRERGRVRARRRPASARRAPRGVSRWSSCTAPPSRRCTTIRPRRSPPRSARRPRSRRAGDVASAQPRRGARGARRRPGRRVARAPTTWPSRIGAWGRESGAVGWALGIGMLFSQVGWRWLRREGGSRSRARLPPARRRHLHGARRARLRPADARRPRGRARRGRRRGKRRASRSAPPCAGSPSCCRGTPSGRASWSSARASWRTSSAMLAYGARDADLHRAARARARPLARAHRGHAAAARGWRTCRPSCATRSCARRSRTARELAADREWDRACGPLFRALAVRRQNPLQYAAQLRLALDAAARVPDERRGRLEATLLLDARRSRGGAAGLPGPPAARARATRPARARWCWAVLLTQLERLAGGARALRRRSNSSPDAPTGGRRSRSPG